MNAPRDPTRLALAGLLSLTTLAYLRLWTATYAWDDIALVLRSVVTGPKIDWRGVFTLDLWRTIDPPTQANGYYRPIFLLSLAFDRAWVPFDLADPASVTRAARFSHLHSLAWHLLTSLGVWALLRRLVARPSAAGDAEAAPSPWLPLLGAGLFALHPVQSEAVALVAARNDSLAAAFVLAALLLTWRRDAGPLALAGAALAAALALLSKESAALALALLWVLDWTRTGERLPRGRAGLRYVAIAAGCAAALGLRIWAGVGAEAVPALDSAGESLQRGLQVLSLYAGLIVWPWPLTPARSVRYLPALGELLFGLVVAATLAAAAIRWGRDRRLVLGGLALAALGLAPSLAATLDKGILGERYLYLPMVGVAAALAGALPRPGRGLLRGAAALALICAGTTTLRLGAWESSRTLWGDAHETSPSAYTHAGLAFYLKEEGLALRAEGDRSGSQAILEEAREHYNAAIAGSPPYLDACSSVIMIHLLLNQPEAAARRAEWAQRRGCGPTSDFLEYQSVALAGVGRWDEAMEAARAMPGGPAGQALLIVGAAQARAGNWKALGDIAERAGGDYLVRVLKMLRLGGEAEAAAQLEAMMRTR